MKLLYKYSIILVALFLSSAVYSQGTLKGTVIDIANDEGLPGASVTVKGSTTGAITDMNGNFSMQAPASGSVEVKFVGYNTITRAFAVASGETTNLGKIGMAENSTLLGDVVIVGVADVAKDRKTPVAMSTIKAEEIQEKLGSQELPELLNNTPSVYATKTGGGFGDSRINIRGFGQENLAVLINGVPVNDMENGAVYWSNWSGLSDVATFMQVQRGLGSSKLAISSVGGTINILTKTTDKKQGGSIGATVGNDGFNKVVASYSTGQLENGLAVSALFSRTAGDGYVNATQFEGYNYFLGIGWSNDKHNVQYTVTGAPQVHNQRTSSFFNMATLEDYVNHGTKYNYNQGELNGEEFNWRRNFYHKPVTSVNWDWTLSDNSSLSTVVYASFGRGGGTGDIGRLDGNFASDRDFRDGEGSVNYDGISSSNGGTETAFTSDFSYANQLDPLTNSYIVNDDEIQGTDPDGFAYVSGASRRNGMIRRASMNSHNWVGAIANYNTKLSDQLVLDFGIDLRNYKGIHYRRVDNLLGADGYRDNDDINNPFNVVTQENESNIGGLWNVFKSSDDEVKINYYNDGLVKWIGAFTQLEYSQDAITAFVQGAVSNQSFKRIDYFRYADDDPLRETDWEAVLGGNIKGGANYNIDEKHNVFINGGYYSKQPTIDVIYPNNDNILNEGFENEHVTAVELGYGLRTQKFTANVNLYSTAWDNRYLRASSTCEVINGTDTTEVQATANLFDVKEIHNGIEFDAKYRVSDKVSILGMISLGDWQFDNDVTAAFVDQDGNAVPECGETTLFLDGVKVGSAAQTTGRLGLVVKPVEGLSIDLNMRFVDGLYADINAEDFDDEDHDGSLLLPSYGLMDAGLSYKLKLGPDNDNTLGFRLNVNNVLNEEYISDSVTNYHAQEGDETYEGISTDNKVFFGFGTTWNFGVRYSF